PGRGDGLDPRQSLPHAPRARSARAQAGDSGARGRRKRGLTKTPQGAASPAPEGVGAYLSALRTTSFSPDQVSSTAQTFTSTNPRGSASARTTSSVMSV